MRIAAHCGRCKPIPTKATGVLLEMPMSSSGYPTADTMMKMMMMMMIIYISIPCYIFPRVPEMELLNNEQDTKNECLLT